MNKKQFTPGLFGICSLLVTLAVICMAVFSVLSLSTAGAGKRLSEVSAEKTAQYYRAELKANEIIAYIRKGEIPEGVAVNGEVYSFSVEQNESISLFVELSFDGKEYEINKWQSVRTAEWEADEGLDLFDPIQ